LQDRFDFTLFLLTVVICWVMIPATIFGKPFFEPTDIGDQAHGFRWLVGDSFLCCSLARDLVACPNGYARDERPTSNQTMKPTTGRRDE
jgi:hypothetical protein